MAGPHPAPTSSTRPRSALSRICRWIAITLLSLIVLLGITVLIIWLVVKPRQLVYTLEEGSVNGFDLGMGKLNGTFNFVLRAYNRNKKVSVYYDSIVVSVWFDDQMLAFQDLEPFHQAHRNATRLYIKADARSTPLMKTTSDDLNTQRRSRELELDVQVKSKLRFKVGIWKSRTYTLSVICTPAVVHLGSSKLFQRTYCDYDI